MLKRLYGDREPGPGGPARYRKGVLHLAKGNLELWVNLFVIGWALAFMLWQGVGFTVTVGTVFAIWAILTVSLNLVVGFTGLLSVGHVAFFGIGAYATAILTSNAAYDQPPHRGHPDLWLALLRRSARSVWRWPVWWPWWWAWSSTASETTYSWLVSFGFAIIGFQRLPELARPYQGAHLVFTTYPGLRLPGGCSTAKWNSCC